MKEIRAYIQPFMLPRVTQTLLKIPGFPGMNVSDCEGFDGNSAEDGFTPYTPKKRIEIFAPDELVKIIFDTLIQAAILITHSSLRCRKGRSYRGQQKREDKRRGKRKLELMQEPNQTAFTSSASFMRLPLGMEHFSQDKEMQSAGSLSSIPVKNGYLSQSLSENQNHYGE